MRSLRTLFVPLLTGTFIATTAAIPAVAQDNGPYDNSQAQMQQQDNSPAYGPSYDNDQSAVQPQDQENDQYNGPEMQPQQDQLNSEDPGRAAVEQVDSTPPPFPADAYDQPPMPGDGYVWTPGYWGWNGGWNWIPGAWAYPPYVGALWTPGYWGWAGGYYGWYPGYWGLTVGFYGGIYYGCGYWGRGFYGGRWDHGHYYNNRNANNIRNTSFHSYSGERSPSGSGGRQFSSAGYARGAVDRGAANGRDAMNESAARANAYDSNRGGGMQYGANREFNGTVNRSYGNSTARNTGSFGGAPTRVYNLPRGNSNGQAASRSFSQSGGSRGYSGGGNSSPRGGFSGGNGGFHGGGTSFGGGGGFHGGGGGRR
jgi:hypothetical protein